MPRSATIILFQRTGRGKCVNCDGSEFVSKRQDLRSVGTQEQVMEKSKNGWRDARGNSGFLRTATVNWVLIVLILAVVSLYTSLVHAEDAGQWEQTDPVIRQWFETLMMPDNPDIPCCSFADAYYADIVESDNGHLVAVVTDDRPDQPLGRPHVPVGNRVVIPPNKIKWNRGNPTGHIVLFMNRSLIVFCYVQNGSS